MSDKIITCVNCLEPIGERDYEENSFDTKGNVAYRHKGCCPVTISSSITNYFADKDMFKDILNNI